MNKHCIQVNKEHYFDDKYNHKARWLSYYYQIKEVINLKPAKILEIGIGNGLVAKYLQERNYNLTTLDLDKELKPDITASVLKMPVEDNGFDLILCAEVLEHLPFENFSQALDEIKRVAKNNVILSLPDHRRTLLNFTVKFPFIRQFNIFIKIPSFKKHKFDGQHYWEIGKSGYPVSKIKENIKKSGLKIIDNFTPFDAPSNHYFILKK